MQSMVDSANSDAKAPPPPPRVERAAADRDTHLGLGNGDGGESTGAGARPHAAASHVPSDNTHQSDGHVLGVRNTRLGLVVSAMDREPQP